MQNDLELIEKISLLQTDNGLSDLQSRIIDGSVWHMEGSAGRGAMDALRSGACYLPAEGHFKDYWGNRIPLRGDLKDGTTGTLGNCKNFYGILDNN